MIIAKVGRRTAAAMRKESPKMARHYESVVNLLTPLTVDEETALIAIIKHAIEVEPILHNSFFNCPTLAQLEKV